MANPKPRSLPNGTVVYELDADEAARLDNESTLRGRVEQAIATLEQAYTARQAGAAPTPAVLWLSVRVVVALARLTLGRLDAT